MDCGNRCQESDDWAVAPPPSLVRVFRDAEGATLALSAPVSIAGGALSTMQLLWSGPRLWCCDTLVATAGAALRQLVHRHWGTLQHVVDESLAEDCPGGSAVVRPGVDGADGVLRPGALPPWPTNWEAFEGCRVVGALRTQPMKQPSFVLVWTLASVFGVTSATTAQEKADTRPAQTVRARAVEGAKAAPQDPAASVRRELRKILAEVDQQDLSPEEKKLVRQAIERAAKKVAAAAGTAPVAAAVPTPPAPPAPPAPPTVARRLPEGAIVVQEVEGKPAIVMLDDAKTELRISTKPPKAADLEVHSYPAKPVIVREGRKIDGMDKETPRTFTVLRQGKDGAMLELQAAKAAEEQRKASVERAIKVAKESQDLQREIGVVRERAMVVRAKAEAERAKVEAERAARRAGDGNQELRAMIEQMRAEMQELRQMVREMHKQAQPGRQAQSGRQAQGVWYLPGAAGVEPAKLEGRIVERAVVEEAIVESPVVEIVEVEAPTVEVRTAPASRRSR